MKSKYFPETLSFCHTCHRDGCDGRVGGMRVLLSSLVILMSLCTPAWGESSDDLVKRNDLYYKKFTDTPFTGTTLDYYSNGQLSHKVNWKNGKKEGIWEWYDDNGQLLLEGNFKNNMEEGLWKSYHDNGHLKYKQNLKDGKAEGVMEWYDDNGLLKRTETWRKDKMISCKGNYC